MVEIKRIVCNDTVGETLWGGVLLPLKKDKYEGYIHSSIIYTYINFEYFGSDVKMTVKRQNPTTKKIDTSMYDLILVNRLGKTEWFTTSDRNTIVCTMENVSNVVASNHKRQLEHNKLYIR